MDKTPVPNDKITAKQRREGLTTVVQEGIASYTMEALSTGVFLVGITLYLGASNLTIGILAALPFLSNLFQIPAIHLVEKYRNRRKIVAICCYFGRSFLLLIALAPLLPDKNIALILVIIGVAVRYCVGAMATCGWNSWMCDLVPVKIRGRFFSRRLFYTTGIGTLLSLTAGFFLDGWEKYRPDFAIGGYSILYLMAFVAAMTSSTLILRIPHPRMPTPDIENYSPGLRLSYLKAPFKNENFFRLIMFLMSWNFAINLAAPFFTVYMLKTLNYDMSFVIAITILSKVVNVISLKLWGKYSDRYSNKTILRICGTLFIICVFGWTFTTFPDKHFLTTPLLVVLHILMGMGSAGVNLGSSNIALKLAPKRKATAFLAVNGMLSSLAAGIAPLIGGAFADFFEDKGLSLDFHYQNHAGDMMLTTLSLEHWDFFFIIAFMMGIYAMHRLSMVEEKGTVREKVVIREMMLDTGRVLKTLSSVGGLRDITMSPMAMMVNLIKKKGPSDDD